MPRRELRPSIAAAWLAALDLASELDTQGIDVAQFIDDEKTGVVEVFDRSGTRQGWTFSVTDEEG